MGKSTYINYKWPFSIAMFVYQGVTRSQIFGAQLSTQPGAPQTRSAFSVSHARPRAAPRRRRRCEAVMVAGTSRKNMGKTTKQIGHLWKMIEIWRTMIWKTWKIMDMDWISARFELCFHDFLISTSACAELLEMVNHPIPHWSCHNWKKWKCHMFTPTHPYHGRN